MMARLGRETLTLTPTLTATLTLTPSLAPTLTISLSPSLTLTLTCSTSIAAVVALRLARLSSACHAGVAGRWSAPRSEQLKPSSSAEQSGARPGCRAPSCKLGSGLGLGLGLGLGREA